MRNDLDILKMIDHTLLKPDATSAQVKTLCDEAKQYGFASVCVNSTHIDLVAKELTKSGVKPCVVVGFPLGASLAAIKAFETRQAMELGAREVDMVIDIGAVKTGDWERIRRDIEGVVYATKGSATVKVILETCLLTDEEKVNACKIAKVAGANFVKTSTGFSTGGATAADVRLMRETVGETMGVKASGGVRNLAAAREMIAAGANRLGTSAGVTIAKELQLEREQGTGKE